MLLTNLLESSIFWLIIWLVVFVLAIVIELATEQLVSVWFSGGAIISLILAICNAPWVAQIVVFAVSSALLVGLSQFIMYKKRKNQETLRTNTDLLINEKILVTKSVDQDHYGEGKYRDVVWTLKSDDTINEGEHALINGIEGNKLIVSKIEKEKNL